MRLLCKVGEVKNNHVYSIAHQKTDIAAINSWNGGDAQGSEIAYNLVHDVVGYRNGIHYGGKGIRLDGGGAPQGNFNFNIHHNIIYNTTATGLVVWPNTDDQRAAAGLPNGDAGGSKVFNNTIIGDLRLTARSNMDFNELQIVNNIVAGSGLFLNGSAYSAPPEATVEDNLFEGNGNSIAGNIQANPLLTNSAAGDFTLQASSPAINEGVVISPYTNGFQGVAPDLGAIEYGSIPFTAGAVVSQNDLADLTVVCSFNSTTQLVTCDFSNLPKGRKLPDNFTLRADNQTATACTGDYNSSTHQGSFTCTIDGTNLNGMHVIELSANGVDFVASNQTIDFGMALPVNFIDFKGEFQQNIVQLDWLVGQEEQTSHYEIQRSLDGADFQQIGTMDAKGEKDTEIVYQFLDPHPPLEHKQWYYRLKAVDHNGQIRYSSTIVLTPFIGCRGCTALSQSCSPYTFYQKRLNF